MRWIVGVGGGVLLTVLGLIIIVGNVGWVMSLAGAAAELPAPKSGDVAWIGIGFLRVFGAALIALGMFTAAASRLDAAAARRIRTPLAIGLAVLLVLTAVQAAAIWSTPSAWVLCCVIAVACASVFTWGVTETALHGHNK